MIRRRFRPAPPLAGTYRPFRALLGNYEAELTRDERDNAGGTEREEAAEFLRAAMGTAPMRYCHNFCRSVDPNRVPEDEGAFLGLLRRIWFGPYRRRGGASPSSSPNSSGFEHVFVGEVDRGGPGAHEAEGGGERGVGGSVLGLHNWIQIYLEERRGNIDYRGFVRPKRRSRPAAADGESTTAAATYDERKGSRTPPDGMDRILTIQFTWNGAVKYVGTTLIGVSPEFELALFTTVFLVGRRGGRGDDPATFLEDSTTGRRIELDARCFPIAGGKVGTCYLESPAQGGG